MAASHMGVFFNVGQCCCAGTRIYVQGTAMSIHISYLVIDYISYLVIDYIQFNRSYFLFCVLAPFLIFDCLV